ncbi:SRPBCC family protein [Deinococcus pimensis]|uniref:SRPBCC family protein n=1 Tax=Deinococcus pimensis TaxID=309888 RepID=UPI000489A95A|nr:SRPBCC family protein [Deinococcus pimensis]
MEFENTKRIQAPVDDVYAWVSDVRNLPKYLPTTREAHMASGEKVHVEGEAHGHQYASDGFFRRDDAGRRMEWSSDGDFRYAGWLQVKPVSNEETDVTVHLTFDPTPQESANRPMPGQGPDQHQINEGIVKALDSIKNQIEGHGGKEEPPSAH